jgi:uncharacterized protein
MKGYLRGIIRQKIVDAQAAPLPEFTFRDTRVPEVKGKAIAVIGMRRSGKTTLLKQIISERVKQGVPREGMLYFSFEDERLAGMESSDLDIVVEEFYRLYPQLRGQERVVLFFDEIQVVPGWELFIRRLLDTENAEIFISGSSSRLLSREVATSMRGRAMEAVVYPFSFREYLRHKGVEPSKPVEEWTTSDRSTIEGELRNYLAFGGFPETTGITGRDRQELLRGYVDVALLRDVIERYAVTNPVALRWMVRQLLGNAAGSFSINRFYADLKSQGFSVAKDTLHTYLGYLEDSFLLQTLCLATDSERRRMVNPRKVYPVDTGLIPLFDRSGKENSGHALETAVFLELARRGYETGYVHTTSGYEVDFLARDMTKGDELIQVCTDLTQSSTREREVRALLDAAPEFRNVRLRVITLEAPPRVEFPPEITITLASEWLLLD